MFAAAGRRMGSAVLNRLRLSKEFLKQFSNFANSSTSWIFETKQNTELIKQIESSGLRKEILIYGNESYEAAKDDGFTNVILLDKKSSETPDIKDGIVVCAMNDEALNVYYSITLRANGFNDEIVALSDTKEDNRKLLLAGVSKIFDMYDESASQFVEMIENKVKRVEK